MPLVWIFQWALGWISSCAQFSFTKYLKLRISGRILLTFAIGRITSGITLVFSTLKSGDAARCFGDQLESQDIFFCGTPTTSNIYLLTNDCGCADQGDDFHGKHDKFNKLTQQNITNQDGGSYFQAAQKGAQQTNQTRGYTPLPLWSTCTPSWWYYCQQNHGARQYPDHVACVESDGEFDRSVSYWVSLQTLHLESQERSICVLLPVD